MSGDDSLWPIPAGLSRDGRKAAEVITQYLVEKGIAHHGGGGKFYTPAEWADREELYGTDSLLVITHDGGAHAAAFSYDGERYGLIEGLDDRLRSYNMFVEQCTSWYSSVHFI